jgi:DNA invertase Pin-like site-specific DNA recombinase
MPREARPPIALYHRASTVDQDPGLAREELHAAAKARGLNIVLDVEETGSGARNDRPGLAQVMDAARRGRIAAVLVHKLDRWGRSALDVLHNIRTLEEAGVEFIVTSQGLHIRPAGDAVSKLILGVLASVAEFEKSLIVERTRLGLDKARRAGKRLGRPLAADAPDPGAVAIQRAEGASWATISRRLHCHASAARRALHRLVENGTQDRERAPVETERAA